MTDAVAIFSPIARVLDANGAPVSGAQIEFYEAGTAFGTPLTVFSNSALTASLGAIVYTDSAGTLVASSGSATAVMVYTGSDPYAVIIKDGAGVTIRSLDNIKGAVDTSAFLTTGSTSTLSIPVTSKTSNYTLVAADRSKLVQGNSTGGNFTLTLTSAITLGDGWNCEVRNSGTAGQFILAASEAIAFEGGSFTARAFEIGEAATLRCDGTAFKIVSHTPPLMASRGPGVIAIADRIIASPVSPTPGARYIVQTAFSPYATGDIIEANGSSFNKYTPATDCGWVAYVQDEDRFYSFQGSAWVDRLNTTRAVDMPVGTVCQIVSATYATNADLTVAIPLDNTIPQNTEGTEIVTGTITLSSATNKLRVRFFGFATGNASGTNHQKAIAAVFQDAVANAVFATVATVVDEAGSANDVVNSAHASLGFEVVLSPATTSAITIKVRVGANAGTIRMNGAIAAGLFGGVAKSTLILEEIVAS